MGEGRWEVDILIPAHRIVVAAVGGRILQVQGEGSVGTFRGYRALDLPGAVHGMIAWPNTVLLSGPGGPVVIDPGYSTQGDMLVAALALRGLTPDDVRRVLVTHLHTDHVSALPQLGEVDLWLHELEPDTVHGRTGRGWRDRARQHLLVGDAGPVIEGVRFIHTPGHCEGHVSYVVDAALGPVVVAGDTLGPDPAWFAAMDLPESFPERAAHLRAFQRIAATRPAMVIPGHYDPVTMGTPTVRQ